MPSRVPFLISYRNSRRRNLSKFLHGFIFSANGADFPFVSRAFEYTNEPTSFHLIKVHIQAVFNYCQCFGHQCLNAPVDMHHCLHRDPHVVESKWTS